MDCQPPVEHHAQVAILAPSYQRAREIETLLRHPQLHPSLNHSPIKEIQRTEYGFLITSDAGAEVPVLIHYYHVGTYGPARFELEFPKE